MNFHTHHITARLALALAAGPLMVASSWAATATPTASASAPMAPAPSDSAVSKAVTEALNTSLGDEAQKLKVSTKKGIVTLSGWINQPDMEAQARKVASEVPGAKKVYSRIRLWSTENSK